MRPRSSQAAYSAFGSTLRSTRPSAAQPSSMLSETRNHLALPPTKTLPTLHMTSSKHDARDLYSSRDTWTDSSSLKQNPATAPLALNKKNLENVQLRIDRDDESLESSRQVYIRELHPKLLSKFKSELGHGLLTGGSTIEVEVRAPAGTLNAADHYALIRTTTCRTPVGKMFQRSVSEKNISNNDLHKTQPQRRASSTYGRLHNNLLTATKGPHMYVTSTTAGTTSVNLC